MTDFAAFDSDTHPIVKLEDDYNNILDHAFEKPCLYVLRVNGSYYEAIKGGTSSDAGTIAYGGADNAGSTDGTDPDAVIQAALDNLTSGRAWKERISIKGSWSIDLALDVPNYTILDMFGAKITQTKAAAPNNEIFDCSAVHDIDFLGGILDCDSKGPALYGITDCYNINVGYMQINNASLTQQGIYLRGHNISVFQNQVLTAGAGILLGRDEADGFTANNIWIVDNYVYNTKDDGIAFDLVEEGWIKGNLVDRNNYTGATDLSAGIKLYGDCQHCTVEDNKIMNIPTAATNVAGIECGTDTNDAPPDFCRIINNTIHAASNTNTYGINWRGVAADKPKETIIEGNTIEDFATGIVLYYMDGGNVINNVVENCTSAWSYDTIGDTVVKFNRGINPINKVATPFDTGNDLIELAGDAASPAASTDYVITNCDVVLSSTDSGSADNAIQIKDGGGNSVNPSTLSTLDAYYLPVGFKVNWGAFTGAAPTVVAAFT